MKTDTLTERELKVIDLCKHGYQNKVIANMLHISLKTVEAHLVHARNKTDARNTVHLVAMALSRGLIAPLCLLLIVCQIGLLGMMTPENSYRYPVRSRTRITMRIGRSGRNEIAPLRANA